MLILEYSEFKLNYIKKNIAILGYGTFGKRLFYKLKKDYPENNIFFIDNNVAKQNEKHDEYDILAPEIAVAEYNEIQDIVYIIPINANPQIANVKLLMANQIAALNKNIIPCFLNVESLSNVSRPMALERSKSFIADLTSKRKAKYKILKVKDVLIITYRTPLINSTGGGPAKVVETISELLGTRYKDYNISYIFKEDNCISLDSDLFQAGCMGAVQFGYDYGIKNKESIFLVHDIFTAFGLYLAGVHYALVYHSQGDIIYESEQMGNRKFTDEESTFIRKIEVDAVNNAEYACFPSEGAKLFFLKTINSNNKYILKMNQFEPMYNSLVEDSLKCIKKIKNINKEPCITTFLSIGQMTSSKGFDRIPKFIEEYTKMTRSNVRWIAIAGGPLKNDIDNVMSQISRENKNITYIQFEHVDHKEINYLFSISDAYLMLHRISIFDVATLEAMYNNIPIILSDIEGNREYNIDNNIFLLNEKSRLDKVNEYIVSSQNNRKIYEENFSEKPYINRYIKLIESLVKCACGEA